MEKTVSLNTELSKATEYLKSIGCNEIFLFGSVAYGIADEFSDIDLAINGLSPRIYFKTVAVISSIIGRRIDLINMAFISENFEKRIRKEGKKLYAR